MNQSNTQLDHSPPPAMGFGETSSDILTEILRNEAHDMLGQAIRDEVTLYLAARADVVDADGHPHVVRNGYLPKRQIMTGIGPVRGAAPACA